MGKHKTRLVQEISCVCGRLYDAMQEIDDDHTVEVLDLSGQTNESASIEVAVECLRCARLIGLVITHGDFEAVLDCARTLERPEVRSVLY